MVTLQCTGATAEVAEMTESSGSFRRGRYGTKSLENENSVNYRGWLAIFGAFT